MTAHTQSMVVELIIQASPEQVFQAFTNAGFLRQWICDVATVAPHRGGRIYMGWNRDFYTSGEYTDLIPNQKVAFTWFGRGDPGPSHVTVTIFDQGDSTRLTLLHTLPNGKKWEGYAENFKSEWSTTLENLVSILETGKDLRIFNRPMLGIIPGDFNAAIAASLGIPTTEGMRLEDTLEGMGAHAAGLRKDDVLISLAGKPITNEFNSLPLALQGKKGGDTVEVIFYRGPDKKTVVMELTRRPVPDIPFDAPELAHRIKQVFNESLDALEKTFIGATEEQASHSPAPGEWSAKEVLAHLLLGENYNILDISETMAGQPRWSDSYTENDPVLHAAVANSYPSYKSMLDELRRLAEELTAFISTFPPEYVANKSAYFNLGYNLLNSHIHTQGHLRQVEKALQAAKSKKLN